MKRSLGRLIMLMILSINGWGANYAWHLVKSPSSLYVGQSGLVQYECGFEGSAAEYSIKLNLKESPLYSIRILSQQDRVLKGNRVNTFNLLITPKQAGRIDVRLDGTIEYVAPGSIDYTAHLGRDNVSQRDVIVTRTVLPPFAVDALPNAAVLVGDIAMQVRTDKTEVRAYEPLHLSLILKGSGNLDLFRPYELVIPGVKVFFEAPQYRLEPSTQGYTGEVRQEFALVADKSYAIPSITIDIFDTAAQKSKRLQSDAVAIEVAQGFERSSLLDPPQFSDWSGLARYGLYGALVIAGAVVWEVLRRLWKLRPRRRAKRFWDEAATSKELAVVLALSGDKGYEGIIAALEAGEIGLGEAKKKLSTLTTDNEVKK